jgi:HEAT repeat protein
MITSISRFLKSSVVGASTLLLLTGWPAFGVAQAPDQSALEKAARATQAYESGKDATPLRQLEQWTAQAAANAAMRPAVENAMAKALQSPGSPEGRKFLCQQLTVIGGEASVPALAGQLPDPQLVTVACTALAANPSSGAAKALRAALPSLSGPAKLQVINALGTRRDPEAVKPLAEVVKSDHGDVVAAALNALAKIGTPAARKAVAAARKDSADPSAREAAAEATLRVAEGWEAEGKPKEAVALYEDLLKSEAILQVRRGALSAILRLAGEKGAARAKTVLRGTDEALKPVAIAAIPGLKGAGVSAEFAALLGELKPVEQAWLVEALALRADDGARKAVREQLAATDAGVRMAAVRAVGSLEAETAVTSLAQTLPRAKDAAEQQVIVEALVGLRGGRATDDALLAAAKAAPGEAKPTLFAVFPRRGTGAAVTLLLEEAGNADTKVARAAWKALGRLAGAAQLEPVVARLAAVRGEDVRGDAEEAALQTLGRVPEAAHRSGSVRSQYAKATDAASRASLLRLLPACGDAPALDAVKAATADAGESVREAAIRALADWPDASAWDALKALAEQPPNEALRAVAFRGLVRLAGEENAKPNAALLERYRQLLAGARDDQDRKLVLGALAGCASAEALNLALPLLENGAVKAEATQAVRRIAEAIKPGSPAAAQAALDKLK